jgi:hypothetical protein
MNKYLTAFTHSISYGREQIYFSLKYSPRKTLAISVTPDLSVEVTAPQWADIKVIKSKVHKRASWILKQQDYFKSFLPCQPKRQYVSGETHYFLGRQYRLKVIESDNEAVKLKGGYFYISVKEKKDSNKVKSLLHAWMLIHARINFQKSLVRCKERFPLTDLPLPQIRMKKMENRWGSYTQKGVIYLNPKLIKLPLHCIDYVVTHELCHFIEANHNKKFYQLLSKIMPDWEKRKHRLEFIAAQL